MNQAVAKSGDQRIETLRGIAIIAVVAHHVDLWVMNIIATQGGVPGLSEQLFTTVSEFLAPVRIPLFTLLSGWVYALRPVSFADTKPFFQGKFRRIVIPLIFMSTVMYFMTLLLTDSLPTLFAKPPIPVPVHEFWKTWFWHFGHLWFLQALLLIFAVVFLIDSLKLMDNLATWIFWLAVGVALYRYVPGWHEFMSASHAAKIFVFFLVGVGLQRFSSFIFSVPYLAWASIPLCIALVANEMSQYPRWYILLFCGATAPVVLLALNWVWQPLVALGKYSYTIFLWHGVTILVGATLFKSLDSSAYGLLGVGLLAGSLLVPMWMERSLQTVPVVNTCFFGKKAGTRAT